MPIAHTIERFLDAQGIEYEVIHHPRSVSSSRIAQAAHIPGDRLAKSVLLTSDGSAHLMAVIPSTRRVDLARVGNQIHHLVGLATEQKITEIFGDCDPGAIPALGGAYQLETIVDDSLLREPEVYFEAGDHEALIHLSGETFRQLMANHPHGRFSFRA
jgi:Ala-tRNA(Pro) deacylase